MATPPRPFVRTPRALVSGLSLLLLLFTSSQAFARPTPFRDLDGDGYSPVKGDCNDSDASIHPGATETCGDGIDQDCDKVDPPCTCTDADGDGVCASEGDCNDSDSSVYPGATETCNGVDDDCDGSADDGLSQTWYADADGDGYGDSGSATSACTQPSGYVSTAGDCDDSNAAVHPGATETCNSVDDDCDGSADEGLSSTWYKDADGDSYGSSSQTVSACAQPSGYVSTAGDCDDSNAAVHPGATETCNSVDDDCDGSTDEGLSSTWYQDADGDSYGSSSQAKSACAQPSGYVATAGDCNDADATIHPGATELCDGVDDDCDGSTDEGLGSTWYADADGDDYGNSNSSTVACSQPSGYVSVGGDCNDGDATVNPGAAEICDSVDDDCDGSIDEGLSVTWYADVDGDSYGNSSSSTQSCSQPSGYVSAGGDCNDGNAAVHPGASEICDSIDNDCDGSVDEGTTVSTWYADGDGDGYGNSSSSTQSCSQPSGYVSAGGDCNDGNAAVHPGASEVCDSVDNDCDGSVDEGASPSTWYADGDGDGYGNSSSSTQSCSQPSGYVSAGGDCNDGNAAINPGASEVCDSVDNDCDGSVDEGSSATTWYRDADGDGYGTSTNTSQACTQPSGYVSTAGDCNDANASINPSASEITGDSIDENCDGKEVCYKDGDNDGYRPDSTSTATSNDTDCYDAYEATATDPTGDCNDSNSAIRPSASESCDGVDNDCDGSIDEGVKKTYYRDSDGDGYGDSADSTQSCSSVSGYVTKSGDCDDDMWSVSPDGYELCNGLDDDCDGLVDSSDAFDVTSGNLGSFNSACDTYDKVVSVEIPKLKITYTLAGQTDQFSLYDGVLVGGHTPGAKPPSGWPSGCTYFDKGYYWYDFDDSTAIYASQACFSKGTDAGGLDEVYLQVTYLGVTLKGTFDNESDSDASNLDYVDYVPEESTTHAEVWYVSDTASASGIGYTATMEITDARAVADTAY